MTNVTAAVLWQDEKTLSLEPVEITGLYPDELLVQVVACGVCHTDMVMRDQHLPVPQPVVLGHEGAGIVTAVGESVTRFKVGDRVAMTFASCGHCASCDDSEPAYCNAFFPLNFLGTRTDGSTALRQNDTPIHSHIFGQSAFATHAVCHERNAVKVPDAMPLALAGPFGCGFQTGAGAVLNALQVKPGTSVVVLGAGAVGLSAIMAAAIAQASTIVAVDIQDSRLALAKELGATHVINSRSESFTDAIKGLLPQGMQYAIDTTGYMPIVEEAIMLLGQRGIMGLVAATAPGAAINVDPAFMLSGGRTITGIIEGNSDPDKFIPELMNYYQQGKFPVDRLVKYYDLQNINEAIADGEKGVVIKPIVKMPAL